MTYSAAVGAAIRAEMARQGLTQAQLAAVLDLSQSQVSRRLAGHVGMTVAELDVIASWLEVPVEQILLAGAAGSRS